MSISSRSLAPLLATGLAALSLAACGSSSPSSGASDEEKRLAFEDCLRDQGIQVQSSAEGTAIRTDAKSSAGGSAPDPQRAMRTCHKKTGWAPREPSAAEKAEFRDEALRMARCMRAHGVDMPDPKADGAMLMRADPNSATFARAQKACGRGRMAMALTSPAK